MNIGPSQVECPVCNATNIGPQTECLRCHAPLPQQEETPETATCPGCGHEVKREHMFCPQCGAELAPELATSSLACSQCGSQALPGQKFCAQCGAPLSAPPA
jgi:DNA-directed RNA polymerase subunit RPC12/RpoP